MRVFRYSDPIEGFRGYLAYAGEGHGVAAGGLRVQAGLDEATIVRLAQTMVLKERLLGLAVDGAKAGIDFDPNSGGKTEALRRFLGFLRPHLLGRLSLGPDMGTTWPEIENAARHVGVASVKGAVARAQGLDQADFAGRLTLLDVEVAGATLGQRRAGHVLAHAALGAVDAAGLHRRTVRVGIQGFGTLGRAAAMSLTEAGITPAAVTDEHTCLYCHDDVDETAGAGCAGHDPTGLVRTLADVETPQRLLELPMDVVILAACENALSIEQAKRLSAAAVVVGANLGLAPVVEELLHRRGILVVPDFVGGCGGSASMDALFGPPTCPTPTQVLDQLGARMRSLVTRVFEISSTRGVTPRKAAMALSECNVPPGKPYGRWQTRQRALSSPPGIGRVRAVAACDHQRSQIADSRFHGHTYSTPASRAIFCDDCRVRRWIAVEAALAQSAAEVGLIPLAAAGAIAAAAESGDVDLEAIADGIRLTNHSLVAVLTGLQNACAGEAGEFVHYGATTQDIQDTGQALEMRDVLDVVDAELATLVARLEALARAERDTLMIGRTHARPALPTTFGLKVASWLDELLRQAERLEAARVRVVVAELHGGVGTMAAFGDTGPRLLEAFARRLGLGVPMVGWHVARDRVAEYVLTLAMLAATSARIAEELSILSRPEVAELGQAFTHGHIGSSTMPHKRNPESCEQVVVLARLARSSAGLALEAMIGEHERDGRSLRLEWPAVADVSHHTMAAMSIVSAVLEGLSVDRDRMADHARETADAICSEPLMLALGRHMGKQSAHSLVYELSQTAQSSGGSLQESLATSAVVRAHLGPDELTAIFDPARYLGSAGTMVDVTVAAAERWLSQRGDRARAR